MTYESSRFSRESHSYVVLLRTSQLACIVVALVRTTGEQGAWSEGGRSRGGPCYSCGWIGRGRDTTPAAGCSPALWCRHCRLPGASPGMHRPWQHKQPHPQNIVHSPDDICHCCCSWVDCHPAMVCMMASATCANKPCGGFISAVPLRGSYNITSEDSYVNDVSLLQRRQWTARQTGSHTIHHQ